MAAKPILVIEKREKKELPLYIKDCKAEIFLYLKEAVKNLVSMDFRLS